MLAMNYTPSMLAWASGLSVPCPPLTCVADLDDNEKICGALRSLGRMDQAVLVQHAATIVQKLADSDVDVRYEAVKTLGKLDSGALATHFGALVLKLDDADADVRYATVKVFGKLDPRLFSTHAQAITARCRDTDLGVQLAVHDLLGNMYPARARLPFVYVPYCHADDKVA